MIATRLRLESGTRAVPNYAAIARAMAPFACLATIGIEIALMAAFLPGTLDRFLHGPTSR